MLARALMQAFGIARLDLEWDEDPAPLIEAFLATGTLAEPARVGCHLPEP